VLLVVPSVTSYDVFFRGLRATGAGSGLDIRVAGGPPLAACEPRRHSDDEVMRLPSFRSGSLASLGAAAWSLSRHVRTWRPAVVHSHFTAGVVCAAAARGLSGSRGARWIATFHGLHGNAAGGEGAPIAACAERFGTRSADVTFVLNKEDVPSLASRVPRADVRWLGGFGLGCDLAQNDPGRFTAVDVARIRLSYRIGRGPVMAYIGRKTEFKGYHIAVEALRIIRKTMPEAVLVVAGVADAVHATGLSEDGSHHREGIIDLGWQHDVTPVLAIADVCVFPSAREGMPVNLMEALAMGVPCVTCDTRGCRDVVRSGVDGYVVPERNPQCIAAAVERVVSSPARQRGMRDEAIAGRGRFDREEYLRRQVAFYEQAE
jgi:glycosyltransferase involved in cell wall biosynthesis